LTFRQPILNIYVQYHVKEHLSWVLVMRTKVRSLLEEIGYLW